MQQLGEICDDFIELLVPYPFPVIFLYVKVALGLGRDDSALSCCFCLRLLPPEEVERSEKTPPTVLDRHENAHCVAEMKHSRQEDGSRRNRCRPGRPGISVQPLCQHTQHQDQNSTEERRKEVNEGQAFGLAQEGVDGRGHLRSDSQQDVGGEHHVESVDRHAQLGQQVEAVGKRPLVCTDARDVYRSQRDTGDSREDESCHEVYVGVHGHGPVYHVLCRDPEQLLECWVMQVKLRISEITKDLLEIFWYADLSLQRVFPFAVMPNSFRLVYRINHRVRWKLVPRGNPVRSGRSSIMSTGDKFI
mmetsp:Transcript_18415/g.60464  ORF Transcript_18415/g.60464 Transcript_18415/m.60464 type:complete len:304 (+) Transcript_18415:247-1158(+)